MADSPRIEALRRRVQADPASFAFAALADEYRKAGRLQEAIDTCRTGLTRHPDYLSAHVTLGRALLETGALEDAREELEQVLQFAPENLAALRGLGDLHRRAGEWDVARERLLAASALAPQDRELRELLDRLPQPTAATVAPEPVATIPATEPEPLMAAAAEPAPAPEPEPLVAAAAEPAPAAEPEPLVVAAAEPAPAAEPEPLVAAAAEPAPEPEPLVAAAAEPAPAAEPEPLVVAAAEPAPAAEPEPLMAAAAVPEPAIAAEPLVAAAAEPAPAAEPEPLVVAAAEPAPADEPEPLVVAAAEPAPAAEPEPLVAAAAEPEPAIETEPEPTAEPELLVVAAPETTTSPRLEPAAEPAANPREPVAAQPEVGPSAPAGTTPNDREPELAAGLESLVAAVLEPYPAGEPEPIAVAASVETAWDVRAPDGNLPEAGASAPAVASPEALEVDEYAYATEPDPLEQVPFVNAEGSPWNLALELVSQFERSDQFEQDAAAEPERISAEPPNDAAREGRECPDEAREAEPRLPWPVESIDVDSTDVASLAVPLAPGPPTALGARSVIAQASASASPAVFGAWNAAEERSAAWEPAEGSSASTDEGLRIAAPVPFTLLRDVSMEPPPAPLAGPFAWAAGTGNEIEPAGPQPLNGGHSGLVLGFVPPFAAAATRYGEPWRVIAPPQPLASAASDDADDADPEAEASNEASGSRQVVALEAFLEAIRRSR